MKEKKEIRAETKTADRQFSFRNQFLIQQQHFDAIQKYKCFYTKHADDECAGNGAVALKLKTKCISGNKLGEKRRFIDLFNQY